MTSVNPIAGIMGVNAGLISVHWAGHGAEGVSGCMCGYCVNLRVVLSANDAVPGRLLAGTNTTTNTTLLLLPAREISEHKNVNVPVSSTTNYTSGTQAACDFALASLCTSKLSINSSL